MERQGLASRRPQQQNNSEKSSGRKSSDAPPANAAFLAHFGLADALCR
jgi:hypothetical protein